MSTNATGPILELARMSISEEWKDVPGFEGYYQVSNHGRVKTMPRIVMRRSRWGSRHPHQVKERLMSLKKAKGFNYVAVNLTVGGSVTRCLVHRLVLEAFVGPCPAGMECRHFPDRDTANNRLDNLQWGTPVENARDSLVHGTSSLGRKASPESRARMSAAQSGRKLTEDHKRKIGLAGIGRKHSEATKRQIGLSQKGKFISYEQRAIVGAKLRGRKLTEAHRAKIAAGLRRHHDGVSA